MGCQVALAICIAITSSRPPHSCAARRACPTVSRASLQCRIPAPPARTSTAESWHIGDCSGMNVTQSPPPPSGKRCQAGTSITFATPALARRLAKFGDGYAGISTDVVAVQDRRMIEVRVGRVLEPGRLERPAPGQPRVHDEPEARPVDPEPGVP